MKKTSALKKDSASTVKGDDARDSKHHHRWIGYVRFKCRCGKTHRDRVYVACDGYLLSRIAIATFNRNTAQVSSSQSFLPTPMLARSRD